MPWRPGTRAHQRALESPYEDVPDHLRPHLHSWVVGGLANYYSGYRDDRIRQVAIHFRAAVPGVGREALEALMDLGSDDGGLLDLVEAMLELYGFDDRRAVDLKQLLEDGNSAYTVRDDWRGLEMRIVPEVKDQVQAVVDSAIGSAGDHLRNAWNEAYGRAPDPVKAYAEAIKAVEAAMAPVVSPTNLKATLGTIIKDVDNKPSKWVFEIADGRAGGVDTVLRMMKMLWDGQTSRHGGVKPTPAETTEEARAAVHLAATLVQFAVGRTFRLA